MWRIKKIKIDKYIDRKNNVANLYIYSIYNANLKNIVLKIFNILITDSIYIYINKSSDNKTQLFKGALFDNNMNIIDFVCDKQGKDSNTNIDDNFPEQVCFIGVREPLVDINADNMDCYKLQELVIRKKANFIINVYFDENVVDITFDITIYNIKQIVSCLKYYK